MKTYNIPESIAFLAKEYGSEHMPTSEETLRRAVRTKELLVEEDGSPGRKGYTISEASLRAYAEERLKRINARRKTQQAGFMVSDSERKPGPGRPKQFPELYGRYISGDISPDKYYMELFNEKMKWEQIIREKQEQLLKLEYQRQMIINEISNCQSAVDAYADGIARYKS